MSQEPRQTELKSKTQALLEGPLKHIRGAALAAALLPLASIAAAPASAQTACSSGGVCGTVFNDVNDNGIQDVGDNGLEGVKVFICQLCDGTDTIATETGPGGFFSVFVPQGTYTIEALIPTGMQASPPNVGDDSFDSDGVPNGSGFSVATGVSANASPPTSASLPRRSRNPAPARQGTGRTIRRRGRSPASPSAASATRRRRRSAGSAKSARTKRRRCSPRSCRPC